MRLALLTAFIAVTLGVYLIGRWVGVWEAVLIVFVGAVLAYLFAEYDPGGGHRRSP